MNKDYTEWNNKLNILLNSYKQNMVIGYMGALGASDIGDEAMLISNYEKAEKIKSNKINFKIFSMNPKETDSYLNVKSLPFTYTFLSKSFFYRVSSVIDRTIQKPFMNGRKYTDIFSEAYALLWILLKFIQLKTNIVFGKYKKHLHEMDNIDLLHIIGGAYINSWHVKSRIYPFLLEIIIAKHYKKDVIMSGLNLGPLNKYHRFFVRYILSYDNVKLIGFRDWEESLKEIGDNSKIRNKVYYSHDDAFYLEYKGEVNPYHNKKYIVLQAHYWLAAEGHTEKIQKIYQDIIINAIDNDLEIVFISMQSYKNNDDYKFSKEILNKLGKKYQNKIIIPEKLYSPKMLKKIVSDSRLLISTRHHPFLFAVSTNVYAISISYDRYYMQKFKGIANDDSHIFSIDDDEKIIENFCQKKIKEII